MWRCLSDRELFNACKCNNNTCNPTSLLLVTEITMKTVEKSRCYDNAMLNKSRSRKFGFVCLCLDQATVPEVPNSIPGSGMNLIAFSFRCCCVFTFLYKNHYLS